MFGLMFISILSLFHLLSFSEVTVKQMSTLRRALNMEVGAGSSVVVQELPARTHVDWPDQEICVIW